MFAKLFLAVFLIPGVFAYAHNEQEQSLNGITVEDIEPDSDKDYQWLYEITFPQAIRDEFPERSFKSFRVHLKDSYKNFHHPEKIVSLNLKPIGYQTGKITYVGVFQKAYKYDVVQARNGEFIFRVKVHLKNPKAGDIVHFRAKTQEAQDIWNAARVPTNFSYRFEFAIVEKKEQAHFSVNVKDTTRGPYDTNWGRSWSGRTIAHELGHMLGLGDEYKTLSGESDCYEGSLMCQSSRGQLMFHHFYFILRRLVVPSSGSAG